jgi:hypothetical protein
MRSPARAMATAGLLALGACSLWVSSDPEPIGCSAEGQRGPPACDRGFLCARRQCVRCAAREVCEDGLDDDCNGRIDDFCPSVSSGGGRAGLSPPLIGAAGVAKFAGAAGMD